MTNGGKRVGVTNAHCIKVSMSLTLIKENGIAKIVWQLDDWEGEVEAADYFDCLLQIRETFEKKDLKILCNGARYDVYPSRMSRQMGKGIKAYQLTPGKQAMEKDLVDIFEEAEVNKIGTIEQQRKYYDAWLKSLG